MRKRILAFVLAAALSLALAVPAIAVEQIGTMKSAPENVTIYAPTTWGNVALIDGNNTLWVWGEWRVSIETPIRVAENVASFSSHGGSDELYIHKLDGTLWSGTVFSQEKILDDVAEFKSNFYNSAALKNDGSLWLWGRNKYGQIGNGSTDGEDVMIPQKIMEHVVSFNIQSNRSAAIQDDGSLWVWGEQNIRNHLVGDGKSDLFIPTKVMDNVASVELSDANGAAIKTDGSLWLWGSNSWGQIGNGRADYNSTDVLCYSPQKVMDNVSSVRLNDTDQQRVLVSVLKTDDSLWVWGFLEDPEAAISYSVGIKRDTMNTPKQIMENVADYQIESSKGMALKKDGTLWRWGNVNYGDAPTKEMNESFRGGKYIAPTLIMRDVAGFENQKFYRGNTVAALKTDGSLWLWGSNDYHLHHGGPDNSNYPEEAWKCLDNVLCFWSDGTIAAAVTNDGSLYTWGASADGSLGNGNDYDISGIGFNYLSTPGKIMNNVLGSAGVVYPLLSVLANGTAVQWTDARPFIDENNRTMVPLRAVGNALGLTVDWDAAKREAIFSDGTKTIYFPIGSMTARTDDGSTVRMDTAAVIVNNRTFAPIRYLAEFFGHKVEWDAAARSVIVG